MNVYQIVGKPDWLSAGTCAHSLSFHTRVQCESDAKMVAAQNARIFSSSLLGLALVLVVIAAATTHWKGGNLFDSQYVQDRNTALACGALLVTGSLLWLTAFVIGLVQFCSKEDWIGRRGLGFFYLASLYLGSAFNFIAVIVYTQYLGKEWSYFLSTCSWTFSLVVSVLAVVMCRCEVRRP